ncbi:MAG TPA: winged helix-turn-helix domain-containing protein [Thermodesulfovibrionales bacterium]|nr:winged helix-turn-helix domain-containing protein [Thermodesulfovibrionales bacterium]
MLRDYFTTVNFSVSLSFSGNGACSAHKGGFEKGRDQPPRENVIRVKDLAINVETSTVSKRGVPLGISATEFTLLLYLVERKGKVFTSKQLLDAVWKDEGFVEPRTVDVHMRSLRTLTRRSLSI